MSFCHIPFAFRLRQNAKEDIYVVRIWDMGVVHEKSTYDLAILTCLSLGKRTLG